MYSKVAETFVAHRDSPSCLAAAREPAASSWRVVAVDSGLMRVEWLCGLFGVQETSTRLSRPSQQLPTLLRTRPAPKAELTSFPDEGTSVELVQRGSNVPPSMMQLLLLQ